MAHEIVSWEYCSLYAAKRLLFLKHTSIWNSSIAAHVNGLHAVAQYWKCFYVVVVVWSSLSWTKVWLGHASLSIAPMQCGNLPLSVELLGNFFHSDWKLDTCVKKLFIMYFLF